MGDECGGRRLFFAISFCGEVHVFGVFFYSNAQNGMQKSETCIKTPYVWITKC